jgi:mono/diheme cytochrome c family protein/thiol-disulfide isomerase/thioredoxin
MNIRIRRGAVLSLGLLLGSCSPSAQGGDAKPVASGKNEAATVREAPSVLKPSEHGVGGLVPDAAFVDLAGKSGRLSDYKADRFLVVATTSTSCPLSKKYLPTLIELSKRYHDQGIRVLLINPTATDGADDVRKAAAGFGERARYVHDKTGDLTRAVGLLSTTDVVVLDAARTVVYHGAVDDQYGFGYSLDQPKHRYLVQALDALLAGKRLEVAATAAPGCTLETTKSKGASGDVTYHNRISRIVQNQCIECHRDGGVAPFSLEKLDDVVAHAAMIRQVVERGTMPPWFAAPAADGAASPWRGDRSLAAAEKADLLSWLAAGKPAGDPADAPLPRTFPKDWQIGKPDIVLQLPNPIAVKATGTMPYQNVVVETNFNEDKWIQALEVQPTAREVVHHVLVFVIAQEGRQEGEERGRDGIADERRGFFAAYVPGTSYMVYPDGFAKKLPKGATLRFQMHYTPAGTATVDQTKLGLVFAKAPVEHEVQVVGLANPLLRIPAGDDNHPESATLRVPADVQLMGFLPHMHLRGKAFRYEATFPNGETRVLLDVPRYDFNWQLAYRLNDPLTIPAGTTLKATGWFDNSDKNPANPDAGKTVRWGPQTYDEMMLGYIEYYIPNGGTASFRGLDRVGGNDFLNELVFQRLDTDHDGKLTKAEAEGLSEIIPRLKASRPVFDLIFAQLDKDKDGKLSAEEFSKVRDVLGKR